ncbi:MAG: nickel ABC transporter permease [Chloroflexota bacterium]
MRSYLLRRVLGVPLLLLGASVVIFLLLRFSPGDPAEVILAQNGDYSVDKETVARLRREWGLDLSLPTQYGRWLAQVARGDFGRSFATNRPVGELIAERLPATLLLSGGALLLALVVATPLGILSAVRSGGLLDGACRLVALAGVSMPGFWLGLLLVWTFAIRLGWLPAIGSGTIRHQILPTIALAAGVAATQTRLIRASLLEVLAQPYVDVARAKGLSERLTIVRHALRNALIPSVTALALSVGGLLGGAAVIETVFAYPGLGKLAVDSIGSRDYPVIQAYALLMTLVFVVLSLVVDALYGLLDPRIRLGAGAQ